MKSINLPVFSVFLLLLASLCPGLSGAASGYAQKEQLRMYADYLENTDISSYLYQSELFGSAVFSSGSDPCITSVQFVDFFSEADDGYELYLQGFGASANNYIGILDIQDGSVCSVFNEYGTIWGNYYDEVTDQDLLVILEGNGYDSASHFRISGYNACWDRIVLAEMCVGGKYESAVITDRYGNRISIDEWYQLSGEIEKGCCLEADVLLNSSDLGYGNLTPSEAADLLMDQSF